MDFDRLLMLRQAIRRFKEMFPELDHNFAFELPADFQMPIALAVGYPEKELENDAHHHAPISINFVKQDYIEYLPMHQDAIRIQN